MDELGAVVEDLRELSPKLINLLLNQEQGLVFFFRLEDRLESMQEKPNQTGETANEEKTKKIALSGSTPKAPRTAPC